MFERVKAVLGLASGAYEPASARAVHYGTDYGRDILGNDPDGWEHDARMLWWSGPGTPNGFGNPPPGAGATLAGAEALPAVLRCTAIIADTLAGMPWRVYKGYDLQDSPRWITDPQLLRNDGRIPGFPIPRGASAFSQVEFWANWITSAVWFGDGWVYSLAGRTGQVAAPLVLLDPTDLTFDGEYWWRGGLTPGEADDGQRRPLDMSRTIRLRGEPPYPYDGGPGNGVIQRFADDMALSAAMRAYAGSIFASGIPAGYLKVNSPNPTQAQIDTVKANWIKKHGGRRDIAVLNAHTEFVPVSVSPIDAQLDLARQWSLRDIALAFGLPPYMLGVPGDPSTYANVESRMVELRTYTFLGWIRRAEAALDAQFAAGTEVKIIADALLRADTATRYAAYESALRAKWLTVDEVRALEDRPPLPEQTTTDPESPTLPADPSSAPGLAPAAPVASDDAQPAPAGQEVTANASG